MPMCIVHAAVRYPNVVCVVALLNQVLNITRHTRKHKKKLQVTVFCTKSPKYRNKKILVWNNANYHEYRSIFRKHLCEQNKRLIKENWLISCVIQENI
jgi:nuclear transport factor 2 (NTF2) superfamily protein